MSRYLFLITYSSEILLQDVIVIPLARRVTTNFVTKPLDSAGVKTTLLDDSELILLSFSDLRMYFASYSRKFHRTIAQISKHTYWSTVSVCFSVCQCVVSHPFMMNSALSSICLQRLNYTVCNTLYILKVLLIISFSNWVIACPPLFLRRQSFT